MSRAVALPAAGQPMPAGIDPAVDECDVCHDLLCYCPHWVKRWPEIRAHQDREPRG